MPRGGLEAELARVDAAWAPPADAAEAARRREDLARRIGVVDPRVPAAGLELVATTAAPSLLARAPGFEAHAVRWPALEGVDGEGVLLRPAVGAPRAYVVALGDAEWTPEALAGIAPGLPPGWQFARRLAELGCCVVAPVLVDRGGAWAGGRPHREYVWRMAFELGRHIIGYEVQRVLALVDVFAGGVAGDAGGGAGAGSGGGGGGGARASRSRPSASSATARAA
jgi:hypothetical protein